MMDYFIDFANHKDTEVYFPGSGVVPLKRGQHIFGTLQMADFFGVDRGRIRRKLKILENIDFLTIKTTNKYSIATIVNFDTYQTNDDTNDHQNSQRTTSNRPATDQQPTTPKNDKNDKNDILVETQPVSTNGTCPYEKIKDLYHRILPELPRVRILTDKRKSQLKARWNQGFELKDGTKSNCIDFWEKYFNYIRGSKFLMGQVDPSPGRSRFFADLEWITNLSNFTKILEQKYHG